MGKKTDPTAHDGPVGSIGAILARIGPFASISSHRDIRSGRSLLTADITPACESAIATNLVSWNVSRAVTGFLEQQEVQSSHVELLEVLRVWP
jgi:hypothetical protein